jgi:hypothetical protein
MKNKRKQMKKIIKLSVAAALAATAMNAAVVDNVKLDGKARLFYETNNANGTDMLDAENAGTKGQVLLTVGASADVGPIKVNLRNSTLTTMGLEHTVVKAPQTSTADTQNYTDIANVVATIGGTTVVVGKQELNTPMCFTEGWNIHRNTFDANVLVNKGLVPNTTLVFADVKSTNASGAGLTYNGAFTTALNAEMMAAHTTIASLPVNAYYYELSGTTASWFDTKATIGGIKFGAIYAQLDQAATTGSAAVAAVTASPEVVNQTTGVVTPAVEAAAAIPAVAATNNGTASAWALSAATKVAGLNVFAAYSSVSDDGGSFASVATSKKTKLPTQAVYVDGQDVAAAGADTFKIKLSGMSVGPVKLAVQHVVCDNGTANDDVETDIIATTKIAGIALKALLIQNEEGGSANKHEKFRVYANYSF